MIGLNAYCGCQGSLKVVIPTVVADYGYFPVSRKILSCRGNCYTAWNICIVLISPLLRQFSAVLNEWYLYVAFSYWQQVLIAWTNWIDYKLMYGPKGGSHLPAWRNCLQRQSQNRSCLLWWNFKSEGKKMSFPAIAAADTASGFTASPARRIIAALIGLALLLVLKFNVHAIISFF